MLLIHRRIKKIVYSAQWVHGIGNIVQPTYSPVVAQRPIDPFGSQYLTEMPNMVFPRRGDTRAEQMMVVGMQKLLGDSTSPRRRRPRRALPPCRG